MGGMRIDDPLGHLVPPGALEPDRMERDLGDLLDRRLFAGGFGVPSVPTRFVVRMNPADRAWLAAGLEDRLARALERRAERAGALVVGEIDVAFESEPDAMRGRPSYWAGYAERDLIVLDAGSALQVFARG